MIEQQWAKTTSVARLLGGMKASDRKWRLLCCAFARELWPHLYARGLADAVQDAESFADAELYNTGLTASRIRIARQWHEVYPKVWRGGEAGHSVRLLFEVCSIVVRHRVSKTATVKVASLVSRHVREIDKLTGWPVVGASLTRCVLGPPVRPSWSQSWLTPTAEAIAEEVYREQRWQELPVVADALEDAGCEDVQILGHLRGPGPHSRGCHALDLLLGK